MAVTQTMVFSSVPPKIGVDAPSVYSSKAEAVWDELSLTTIPNLQTAFTQINSTETNINSKEASVIANTVLAQSAATEAASSVETAAASANNNGDWSLLTGALNVPASVNYDGSVWGLNLNLADVTLSEPTALNTDWTQLTTANDVYTAKLNVVQTFTATQAGSITTDNDVNFDLGVTNYFKSTPTAGFTLTFTNFTAGRSGIIILDNSGAWTPAKAANVKADADFLTTIAVAGVYQLGYIADGTNVYVTYSKALV